MEGAMKRIALLSVVSLMLSACFLGCWIRGWEEPWYPDGVIEDEPRIAGYWIFYEAWKPISYYAFLEDGTLSACSDPEFCVAGTYSLSDSQVVLIWETHSGPPSLDSLFADAFSVPDTLFNVFTIRNYRPKPWGLSEPKKYNWLCYETGEAKNCLRRILPEEFPCDCP